MVARGVVIKRKKKGEGRKTKIFKKVEKKKREKNGIFVRV